MLRIILHIALILLGALGGYLYHRWVGCRSGGCPLVSNAWSSVVIGALLCWLVLSPLVDKFVPKPHQNNNIEQGR